MNEFDAFISYSHAADGRLAPAVERGLQRLATGVFQRRALDVFRDESGLSTNPHLWNSIELALQRSRWFVLLASPESARSTWVQREITSWLAGHDIDHLLIVVTDGTIGFDEHGRVDERTDCLPDVVRDALLAEPRWLDLRWAREETQLDLRNGRFRAAMADLASPIHAIPKVDLESEDVRQQRRARRFATGAVTTVAILALMSTVAALVAFDQREQARTQRAAAEEQRAVADEQRRQAETAQALAEERRIEADVQREEADARAREAAAERERADAEARRARARALAAQSATLVPTSPVLGLLLAAEAHVLDATPATAGSLAGALDSTRLLERSYSLPPDVHGVFATTVADVVLLMREEADARLVVEEWSLERWQPTGRTATLPFRTRDRLRVVPSPTNSLLLLVGTSSLWIFDTDSMAVRELPRVDLAGELPVAAWTPDARRVVTLDGADLAVIDVATDAIVTVPLTNLIPVAVTDLAVTNDGRVVVGTEFGINAVRLDGGGEATPAGGYQQARLATDPTGAALAVVSVAPSGATQVEMIVAGAAPDGSLTATLDRPFAVDGGVVVLGPEVVLVVDVGGVGVHSVLGRSTTWLPVPLGTSLPIVARLDTSRFATFTTGGRMLDVWNVSSLHETTALGTSIPGPAPLALVDGSALVQSGGSLALVDERGRTIAQVQTELPVVRQMLQDPASGRLGVVSIDDPATRIAIETFSAELERIDRVVLPIKGQLDRLALSGDLRWLSVHADRVVTIVDAATLDVVFEAPQPLADGGFFGWNSSSTLFQAVALQDVVLQIRVGTWEATMAPGFERELELPPEPSITIDGLPILVTDPLGRPVAVDATIGDRIDIAIDEIQPGPLMLDLHHELLVTTNVDGTMSLWSWPELEPIAARVGDATRAVGFLAGEVESYTVWDLDPLSWRRRACARAGRNLTRAEWDRYVGGEYEATCPQWPSA